MMQLNDVEIAIKVRSAVLRAHALQTQQAPADILRGRKRIAAFFNISVRTLTRWIACNHHGLASIIKASSPRNLMLLREDAKTWAKALPAPAGPAPRVATHGRRYAPPTGLPAMVVQVIADASADGVSAGQIAERLDHQYTREEVGRALQRLRARSGVLTVTVQPRRAAVGPRDVPIYRLTQAYKDQLNAQTEAAD